MDLAKGHAGLSSVADPGAQPSIHATGSPAPRSDHLTIIQPAALSDPQGAVLADASFAPYFFGGRQYCWYDSAWSGPGWYWCGYAWRNGLGWGGPGGWHGWRHDGGHGGDHRGADRGGAHFAG